MENPQYLNCARDHLLKTFERMYQKGPNMVSVTWWHSVSILNTDSSRHLAGSHKT